VTVSKRLINDVRNLDVDGIAEKTLLAARKIISQEGMTPEKIKSTSAAALPVYHWVVSVVNYGNVIKVLHPLRMARSVAEENMRRELLRLKRALPAQGEIRALPTHNRGTSATSWRHARGGAKAAILKDNM